ncbi:MAG: glycosyltransferase family 1 protein [Roseofilum sp. SBFL]|uniref:CgeB family protein n=1 Tax=unclassified Roseofilum TaxID=2620099 RepID=UPI001B29E514|nr:MULTISPECIES: glycosyltransferase [unclassified Roseofilum]MBP0014396.1 glycosyltransferase family 1 protein [Roseofilum sp. SID3]MBP0025961.1 glycosyltransferase family 1 protein [Roseofilum sp. SID2]MBP0036133.1 glycosyltransferase family 1 protein [Roseofilum sp. SID1]MBP0040501.1 glycosyltransferase family 1 protein [Roseofilum sp. SBFL]
MNHKLKIGLRLFQINSIGVGKPGQVQGDEIIARGWQKYLLQHEKVDSVHLYGPKGIIEEDLDVLIHFNPFLDLQENTKNFLYLQNAFSKKNYPRGTVGVFKQVKSKFSGYMFTSKKLMDSCADGAVIPFATDPDFFYPQFSEQFEYPVSFVGNNIRGPVVNLRYLEPALPFGLVMYGNLWSEPLSSVCQGRLPMPDLPKLYSSCKINLNAHIEEHIELDTINLRIFDILACRGFVMSDYVQSIENYFGNSVVSTAGYEDMWAKLVHYLSEPEERLRRSKEGQKSVLSNHTYANRVQTLLQYLEGAL